VETRFDGFNGCGIPVREYSTEAQALAGLETGESDLLVCSNLREAQGLRKAAARLNVPVVTSAFAAQRMGQTIKALCGNRIDAFEIASVSLNEATATKQDRLGKDSAGIKGVKDGY
jgi:hypothetical protein